MIAYLKGILLEKSGDGVVLLTRGGVGYELALPESCLATLPAQGEEAELYVAAVIREDAFDLYGFPTWDERTTFRILLTISKLGPKTALALMSHMGPDGLRSVVGREDPDALTAVPGIGKKTAQHIFLELKYKLKDIPAHLPPSSLAATPAGSVFADALAGLVNLGYTDAEVRPLLEATLESEPDLDVSAALRATLKKLAARR